MGRLDWLLAPLRAGKRIPKPVLLATAASLAAVGGAFGIALAVVEWRDETADLAPVEEQIGGIDSSLSELGSRLDQIETRLNKLTLALSPTPAPTPGPESSPAAAATPAARLTVNSVQRSIEFRPIGSSKPWVTVNVTIENTSSGNVDIFYSGSQFSARDDQNFVYPAVFPTGPDNCRVGAVEVLILSPPLSGGSLGPGEKAIGEMAFDLPEGTVLTELVWATGFGETPETVVDLPPPQTAC